MNDAYRKKNADDEQAARSNLNRLFGRLAFEKGNAYGRGDEEGEDPIARLQDDSIVARRRVRRRKTADDRKPPEAYPGP